MWTTALEIGCDRSRKQKTKKQKKKQNEIFIDAAQGDGQLITLVLPHIYISIYLYI